MSTIRQCLVLSDLTGFATVEFSLAADTSHSFSFSFSLLFCLCLTFDIYIYKKKINYILISIKNETTLRYIH